MGDLYKMILQVILVVSVSVFLCLFVPTMMLIEFFLVMLGMMIIVGGGLAIMREVTMQIDLRHRYNVQQEIRELKLRKFKQQQTLLNNRCKRIARSRISHR
jgi:hypothetical protein